MSKIINKEQIEEIKSLLLARKTLDARKILDNLQENKVIDDLKRLLRNKGKSSILENDIIDIINKYK